MRSDEALQNQKKVSQNEVFAGVSQIYQNNVGETIRGKISFRLSMKNNVKPNSFGLQHPGPNGSFGLYTYPYKAF